MTCFSPTMKRMTQSQGCHCLGGVPWPTGPSSTTPHPRGSPSSPPPTHPTLLLRCPRRTPRPRCPRPTLPTRSTPHPKLSRPPRGATTTRPTTGRTGSPPPSSTSLVGLAFWWMSTPGCHFYRWDPNKQLFWQVNHWKSFSLDLKQRAKLWSDEGNEPKEAFLVPGNLTIFKIAFYVQLTASSRRENGGAYGGDVFGGKWVVSKGKIFQITCSVSWYGRFWSTTNFWYSWKRAPLPPSSLAGSRRGTEASRAAAWWFELLLRVSRWFVTRISSYFLSYFIQLCNAPLGTMPLL